MKLSTAGALGLGALPGTLGAHSFVEPYLLPVPFWLYVYACGATLVITFAALGYFMGAAPADGPVRTWPVPSTPLLDAVAGATLSLLRLGALGCLLLIIVAGALGTADPLSNIAMPLFWMIFLLGLTYLTALAGDIFALVNPWATLVTWAERAAPGFGRGRFACGARVGYWPAFAFYVALIGLELFVLPKPVTLSIVLLAYTLVTFLGVFAFGRADWFRYGEVFSVYFRVVGLLAPVAYLRAATGDRWRVRLRPPLAGALDARPTHLSLVLFVLFMLSSTTYDAVHETDLWIALYWQHLVPLAQPLWGTDMVRAQHTLMPWYDAYQRLGLLLSPFAYLALYALLAEAARRLAKTTVPLRTLMLAFAPSLVPIAVVYHATHYYTLLWTQGGKLARVASDPFGFGWNLLRLGFRETSPPIDMGAVWHTQVALILIGHLASVYLAHAAAARLWVSRRQAMAGQLPLLLLMVAYTAIGLYILSLPLASPAFIED